MDKQQMIINEYATNPVYYKKINDYTFTQHEGNPLCGDNIVVYVKIDAKGIVTDYSFDGDCSTITMAASNFLGDLIIGEDINDIINRDYGTMLDNDFVVSYRRRRAAVIAILAVRNGIHTYREDKERNEFDDLLEDY